MTRTFAPIAALLFSVAILITGQGLQSTLLPVRANLEEFSALMISMMGAAYFLGFTIGCVKSIDLIRKVGHIRVFAAMTAIASSTPLLHGMIVEEFTWVVLRFLTGFCFAALYVVVESWLNEVSSNETRGTVFSVYVVIHLTVVAVGQQMLLLSDPLKMPLFAFVTVLVSLAAVPVALSTSPMPREIPKVKIDLKRLYKISPAGIQGCVAAGITSGIFYSLAPVFTASISEDISLAAWFMTAAVLGGALGQWPLGVVSDRIDRRIVICIAAAATSATCVVIYLFANYLSIRGLLCLTGLWGAFAFPLYAISVAHANDYAEPTDFVMISSGMLLVYGGGAVAGPFLAFALMAPLGEPGMFILIAIVDAFLAVYLLYRMFQREQAPDDEQIAFTEALAAVATKSQVYDYSENEDKESVASSDNED